MSTKQNKYVVNHKLEHVDDNSIREITHVKHIILESK